MKAEMVESVVPPKEEKHEEVAIQIVCEPKKQEEMPTQMVTETEKKPVDKCEPMKEIMQPKTDDVKPQDNTQNPVKMEKSHDVTKVPCSNGKRKAYMVCTENCAKKIKTDKENTTMAQKPKMVKNDYSHVRPKIDTNLKAVKKTC
jgi:hypothetical protein